MDKSLPGLKETVTEHAQQEDSALESLISNQYNFLTSHDKSLNSNTPPEHSTNGMSRDYRHFN